MDISKYQHFLEPCCDVITEKAFKRAIPREKAYTIIDLFDCDILKPIFDICGLLDVSCVIGNDEDRRKFLKQVLFECIRRRLEKEYELPGKRKLSDVISTSSGFVNSALESASDIIIEYRKEDADILRLCAIFYMRKGGDISIASFINSQEYTCGLLYSWFFYDITTRIMYKDEVKDFNNKALVRYILDSTDIT